VPDGVLRVLVAHVLVVEERTTCNDGLPVCRACCGSIGESRWVSLVDMLQAWCGTVLTVVLLALSISVVFPVLTLYWTHQGTCDWIRRVSGIVCVGGSARCLSGHRVASTGRGFSGSQIAVQLPQGVGYKRPTTEDERKD